MKKLGRDRVFWFILVVSLVLAASRRSHDAVVLGRYSPEYVRMMLLWPVFALAARPFILRYRGTLVLAFIRQFAALLLACLAIECLTWAFTPAYKNALLEPDRELGWRHVKGLELIHTGSLNRALEYSNPVKLNQLGQRDLEREYRASPGTVRIGLFGNSLVEALQVPIESTMGPLLEQKLNSVSEKPVEVLNFGVTNYRLGQCLLSWERNAPLYGLDVAILFVTDQRLQDFEEQDFQGLAVRPIFTVEDDRLVRVPVGQFEEFEKRQKEVIENEYGGKRTRRESMSALFLFDFAFALREKIRAFVKPEQNLNGNASVDEEKMAKVLKFKSLLLSEFSRSVKAEGAEFVVAHWGGGNSAYRSFLEKESRRLGFTYVYLDVFVNGEPTRFPVDGHLTPLGHIETAEQLFSAIRKLKLLVDE